MDSDNKSFDQHEKREYADTEILEKPTTYPEHLYAYGQAGLSLEDAEFLYGHTPDQQAKIFHKVDWRLCPMLAVLYLISHLDR